MRFVDLENGSVYNGNIPYIHWFDDKQSINLVYVKKLCVLDTAESLEVKLDSKIFNLVDVKNISSEENINMNDFSYKDITKLYTKNYTTEGYKYYLNSQGLYLHMIYIAASSDVEGEFLDNLYINNEQFTIGSSFWPEYEPHKINLGNLGVEFPESIIKAIYDTNVHEEDIDYITLNRKRKELLIEYWNIIASKGSYQSLYNSLNWFEYGDLIKIKEFWKNKDNRYNHNELNSILSNEIKNTLSEYSKTTYLGLYLALYKNELNADGTTKYEKIVHTDDIENESGKILGSFIHTKLDRTLPELDADNASFEIGIDNVYVGDTIEDEDGISASDWEYIDHDEYDGLLTEEVPVLQNIASKWSAEDLSLKMYLLGNFYETYFMPVHLDLIHSTVEHIVFANTIKILQNAHISRQDYFFNNFSFNCNVKDGDIFFLEDVKARVNNDTILGSKYEDNTNIIILGVESIDKQIDSIRDDNELKTFLQQYYNGIGVIIPFTCTIKLDGEDSIKNISAVLNNSIYNKTHIKQNGDKISFNILCQKEGEYSISICIETIGGYYYTKNIKFNVVDNTGKTLKVYRIKRNLPNIDYSNYLKADQYVFTHTRSGKELNIVNQIIPAEANPNGIGLQRVVVIDCANMSSKDLAKLQQQTANIYFSRIIQSEDPQKSYKYIIFISNSFDEQTFNFTYYTKGGRIIRDDYSYFPQNHHLEEIGGEELSDYIVNKYDSIMVVPDVKYLKHIEDAEWEFENVSTRNIVDVIKLRSVQTPMVAYEKQILDPGFYNIKFKYKLGSSIQEISLNSAFIYN